MGFFLTGCDDDITLYYIIGYIIVVTKSAISEAVSVISRIPLSAFFPVRSSVYQTCVDIEEKLSGMNCLNATIRYQLNYVSSTHLSRVGAVCLGSGHKMDINGRC